MTETTSPTSETPDSPSTRDARDELRAKIEARERRIAERTLADDARNAAAAATDYARQNPLQVVGGAIAVGLLIGLMTRPGRRAVGRVASTSVGAVGNAASGTAKSVGNKVGATVGKEAKKRGSAIGTALADAAVAHGVRLIDEALDGARKGQDTLEDFGDAASAKAREARREAEYVAGSALDKSRTLGQRTRRRARRAVRDIAERVNG